MQAPDISIKASKTDFEFDDMKYRLEYNYKTCTTIFTDRECMSKESVSIVINKLKKICEEIQYFLDNDKDDGDE